MYWDDRGNQLCMRLIDYPVGAIEPRHVHGGSHATTVLKGRAIIDGLTLGPLDVVLGPSNEPHGPLNYPEGCQLFSVFHGSYHHSESEQPNTEKQYRLIQSGRHAVAAGRGERLRGQDTGGPRRRPRAAPGAALRARRPLRAAGGASACSRASWWRAAPSIGSETLGAWDFFYAPAGGGQGAIDFPGRRDAAHRHAAVECAWPIPPWAPTTSPTCASWRAAGCRRACSSSSTAATGTRRRVVKNRAAFERIKFDPARWWTRPARSQEITLFGKQHQMPIAVAPTGSAGLVWYDGEIELARAAATAGIPFTLATNSMTSLEKVAEQAGGTLWFQLYMWPDRVAVAQAGRAREGRRLRGADGHGGHAGAAGPRVQPAQRHDGAVPLHRGAT